MFVHVFVVGVIVLCLAVCLMLVCLYMCRCVCMRVCVDVIVLHAVCVCVGSYIRTHARASPMFDGATVCVL